MARTPKKAQRDLSRPDGLGEGGLTHNPFASALGGVRPDGAGAVSPGNEGAAPTTRPQGLQQLRIRREVKGRGGHPVCRVEGAGGESEELSQALARALGCRVQADGQDLVVGVRDPERLQALLEERGYTVQRAN